MTCLYSVVEEEEEEEEESTTETRVGVRAIMHAAPAPSDE